jgi:hypothetical protein
VTRWERTAEGLRATDRERGAVTVGAPDWEPEGADGNVAFGTASELSLPRVPARIEPEDGNGNGNANGEKAETGDDRGPRVGEGSRSLVAEAALPVTVRFAGPARVERGERIRLSFPERRRVSVAFGSSAPSPPGTVHTPPTLSGVAAALTVAGATPTATGPERSHPAERPHPPRFAFDAGADLPDAEPATGVEIVVPDLESLFPAAPLAYYTGAALRTGDGPRLSVPETGFEYPLGEGARRAPDLFKRLFRADCLVREGDPRAERAGVAGAGERPMGERVARYADADFGGVSLPEWSLAAYVEPALERAGVLPHLLARGATVHRPETEPLSGKALMERSLDSFYRSAPTPDPVDVCEPTLAPGELHCWHAPETPIDVYEGRPAAYRNRLERDDAPEPLRVHVVCNEDRMRAEGHDAAGAYRGPGAGIEVRHSRNLTRAELSEAFRERVDLVHFVGHCEPDGLRCADGTLPAADVGEVGARTFLLNACGSYREGEALVDAGAVAGGVTYRRVLDEQAARVGTTFAGLLAGGFSVARGLDLARRRVMMGADYAVVGDGTDSVVRPAATPVVAEIESRAGAYEVTVRAAREADAGGRYLPPFDDATPRLRGDAATRTLGAGELRALCERASMPVVLDGEFRWSCDLASELPG